MADRTPPRPGRSSSGRGDGARPSIGSPRPTTVPRPPARRSVRLRAGAAEPRRPARRRAKAARSAAQVAVPRRPARSGPGKERPGLAARPRTPAARSRRRPRRAGCRGAILLTIVVMLAVTLVPTLRSLIQQRGDTVGPAGPRRRSSSSRWPTSPVEAALWKDPAYIELQARERLKFVRVGDRAYTVIDAGTQRRQRGGSRAPGRRRPARQPVGALVRQGVAVDPDRRPAHRRHARRHAMSARPCRSGLAAAVDPTRPRGRAPPARPSRRAVSPRWPTAVPAASPTCCAPSLGCPTARRSPRPTTRRALG